ncbi:aspartate/glutamate racemase family protein [Simiduia sp. 21SJ11W-1]|uniref:aspartate/glutamate racemase family protein n=1 Tax=Simiduia sp. 21SJ11W-1 TaxID=2909669 RepID=UPI0020A0A086|nr:aspartate/glutamate racemase family protein [Simiduia sp. 21SJ11W-1]UTA47197.1 aspartate/glutamate racemase family protein [Simiduia sp. 21SJ11W-1]
MKKIGLIGGMSWESTERYYRAINEDVKARLGAHHSARLVLESVDFQRIKDWQFDGNWAACGTHLAQCAQNLERAGADMVLICTNTMHKVADEVQAAIGIPLVHLADATARAVLADGISRVAFLGTRFAMEQPFYIERLASYYKLQVWVPELPARERIHQVIYDELCLGVINEQSREEFLKILAQASQAGAEAAILGCTEIAMLVGPQHTPMRLYDTTAIHAREAVRLALESA